MDSILDQVEDKPAIDRKLQEQLLTARYAATRQCTESYSSVAACLAKANCGEGGGSGTAECQSIPKRPEDSMGQSCPAKGGLCLPTRADNGGDAWDEQWGSLALKCAEEKVERAGSCDLNVEKRCNPQGMTIDVCVEAKMVKISRTLNTLKPSSTSEALKNIKEPHQFLD